MAYTYALINKFTLSHICTGKRVSQEYIVSKTGLKEEKVQLWLEPENSALPTIKQAKTIASCLHIPFAGLYMNPEQVKLKSIPAVKNYRTVYGAAILDDSALNIALLDLLEERDFLKEAQDELSLQSPIFCMSISTPEDPVLWANEIRRLFDIRLETQYRCSSPRKFYLYLRDKVEAAGIFVHCFTDVPVETARGLAIYDSSMPIIGINDEDHPPAKSFSIIHELVHVFKRESSLCNDMKSARKEEVFCNAVAGELLVPRKELKAFIHSKGMEAPFHKRNIEQIANKFSVSREVIIRRLLDTGLITIAAHDAFVDEFHQELEFEKEERRIARLEGRKVPGPFTDVSRDAVDRTSPAVCKVLHYGYGSDLYSKQDIARHLGISQKYVDKFLVEVSSWSR